MPLWEYRCGDCAAEFEVLTGITQDSDRIACSDCGSENVEKLFSSFAPQVASGPCEGPACQPDAPCRESCPCLG